MLNIHFENAIIDAQYDFLLMVGAFLMSDEVLVATGEDFQSTFLGE